MRCGVVQSCMHRRNDGGCHHSRQIPLGEEVHRRTHTILPTQIIRITGGQHAKEGEPSCWWSYANGS